MAHSKGSDKEARYGFLESGKRLHENFFTSHGMALVCFVSMLDKLLR